MSDEFHAILKQYDIIFFAETDMLLGEDAADVPRGFKNYLPASSSSPDRAAEQRHCRPHS
jgi:hypothetical protein